MISMQMPLAFMGMPGHYELLVIAGLALLFFGNRVPGVMNSLGKSLVAFKRGMVEGATDEAVEGSVDGTMDATVRAVADGNA